MIAPAKHRLWITTSTAFLALHFQACAPPPQADTSPVAELEQPIDNIDDQSESNPLSVSYRPPPQDSSEIVEVPDTGINLGWGWDRHRSEPVRSVCVEFEEASEPAQTRYMTMKEVSDSYELMKSMGMSAQASVKTAVWSASGKAAFAKDTNITGYSSNFVMNASVENGVRYAAPADGGMLVLTSAARQLAATNPAEFEHQCGDSFVSAVYAGAKLTAVITIETKSQQEKEDMSATLSGSGWGAEFEASVSQSSGSKTEGRNMSVSVFQTGGRGDGIPKDKDDLLAKLDVLPAIAYDAPKDFHMAVTPYESLANWPPQTLDNSESEFDQLASFWGAYNTLYDELQFVLDHPDEFVAPVVTAERCDFSSDFGLDKAQVSRLERVQDDVLDALHRIENFAEYCINEEEGCVFPENAFRSPYAYRTQLPLEIFAGNEAAIRAGATSVPAELQKQIKTIRSQLRTTNELCKSNRRFAPLQYCKQVRKMYDNVDTGERTYHYSIEMLADNNVVSLAKRRCQNDKNDPLCLSNAEIDSWKKKMTFELVRLDSLAERDRLVEDLQSAIDASPDDYTLADCAVGDVKPTALYSAEEGISVLWYHPSIKTLVTQLEQAAAQ